MGKGYGHRVLNHYGLKNDPTVEVRIDVYGHGHLTNEEVQTRLDTLTDKVMTAMADTPGLRVRLSRIKVRRPREK